MKMPKEPRLVRIEYGHIIKIKSLEKLLNSNHINESTRGDAKEVIELLEKELESLNSGTVPTD
jgi:hypothetical protein